MLSFPDEPNLRATTSWLNHSVLAVSIGLNALFIVHALSAKPIAAEDNPVFVSDTRSTSQHASPDCVPKSGMGAETLKHSAKLGQSAPLSLSYAPGHALEPEPEPEPVQPEYDADLFRPELEANPPGGLRAPTEVSARNTPQTPLGNVPVGL